MEPVLSLVAIAIVISGLYLLDTLLYKPQK